MASLNPPEDVLLDVTLHREGLEKRWLVNAGDRLGDWCCRRVIPLAVIVRNHLTNEEVAATVRAWKAQIDAAKADGWT